MRRRPEFPIRPAPSSRLRRSASPRELLPRAGWRSDPAPESRKAPKFRAASARQLREPANLHRLLPGAGWRWLVSFAREVEDSAAGDLIGGVCLFLMVWAVLILGVVLT